MKFLLETMIAVLSANNNGSDTEHNLMGK